MSILTTNHSLTVLAAATQLSDVAANHLKGIKGMIINKKCFCIFIAFLIVLITGCSTQTITQNKPKVLNSARYGHAVVNDNNNIYVFGGSNKQGFLSSIEIINPKSGKHLVLENKLIPRRYFSAVWDG